MAVEFPIKLKSTYEFVDELKWCEYGRYEDALATRESGDQEAVDADDYGLVLCDFIDRHKAMIEVRNKEELCELYWALCSGTIGEYRLRAASNMANKIRPLVNELDPKLVEQWNAPWGTGRFD